MCVDPASDECESDSLLTTSSFIHIYTYSHYIKHIIIMAVSMFFTVVEPKHEGKSGEQISSKRKIESEEGKGEEECEADDYITCISACVCI